MFSHVTTIIFSDKYSTKSSQVINHVTVELMSTISETVFIFIFRGSCDMCWVWMIYKKQPSITVWTEWGIVCRVRWLAKSCSSTGRPTAPSSTGTKTGWRCQHKELWNCTLHIILFGWFNDEMIGSSNMHGRNKNCLHSVYCKTWREISCARQRQRWEDGIITNAKEICCEDVS
jgi:hypothetical protein